MADDTTRLPQGIEIEGSLLVARPVDTLVRDTITGDIFVSTNATMAAYAQVTNTTLGTLDHAALTSNLAWATSGHTGTASNIAGFTGGGAADDLTGTETTALLDVFTALLNGLVPASGGAATDFLSADGTFSVPAGGTATVWTVVTEATAARTAANGEFVLVDAATCIVTLPAPVANIRVAIKMIFATVTDIQLKTSGGGILIDGTDYSATGLTLTEQYEQINVISDGTDWFIY